MADRVRRRRRRAVPKCVYCGVERFVWPRSFTQEFFEEHACPDRRGHLYVDEPAIAAMGRARG